MKKVIITGATGAIGHALIDACIVNEISVYALCRPDSLRIAYLPKNKFLHIIKVDLSNILAARNKLPDKCDAFYHFGWVGPFGNIRNDAHVQTKNIKYTIDAVELAHQCGCYVFIGAGSQAEYGRVIGKLASKTPTFPENGYGIAKLCAGQMSRIQAHKYGIKHVWTRILSVYGSYDNKNTLISYVIRKLLKGEKPICTKGEQLWDYLYSKDIGNIMLKLGGDKSIDGKIYCLGTGNVRPLKEYIEIIRDMINPRLSLGLGEIEYSPNQVMYLCADTTELMKDIQYICQYSFEEGIAETIKWYKSKIGQEFVKI